MADFPGSGYCKRKMVVSVATSRMPGETESYAFFRAKYEKVFIRTGKAIGL